ncbi:hypothetical protein I3W98_17095 [Streptomyces cavourensis]|nr:hypothetical protein [Streptomyces cavourensis]
MTSIGGAEMVDWNLAVATATRLVRPGPEISRRGRSHPVPTTSPGLW